MSEQNIKNRLLSVEARKRFGARHTLGCMVLGESLLGDQGIFPFPDDPVPIDIAGIYQIAHGGGKQFTRKLGFYWPKNTYSAIRQANRTKFANGVAAWQGLTEQQKNVYRKNSIGKGMSGYNLFLRLYLQSN